MAKMKNGLCTSTPAEVPAWRDVICAWIVAATALLLLTAVSTAISIPDRRTEEMTRSAQHRAPEAGDAWSRPSIDAEPQPFPPPHLRRAHAEMRD